MRDVHEFVCVCVCGEATQEDSEQQLDRFKFTQDGEKRRMNRSKKQSGEVFSIHFFSQSVLE